MNFTSVLLFEGSHTGREQLKSYLRQLPVSTIFRCYIFVAVPFLQFFPPICKVQNFLLAKIQRVFFMCFPVRLCDFFGLVIFQRSLGGSF